MNSKIRIDYDAAARPVYLHLEPLVEKLIENGNAVATTQYRWGENRTGWFCQLSKPIDFAFLEQIFDIPDFLILNREGDAIECARSWATIYGGTHVRG